MTDNQMKINPSPFKPHKGLFWSLLTIFVFWVGVLIYLYVTTVKK